jgi:hypothetical protein
VRSTPHRRASSMDEPILTIDESELITREFDQKLLKDFILNELSYSELSCIYRDRITSADPFQIGQVE